MKTLRCIMLNVNSNSDNTYRREINGYITSHSCQTCGAYKFVNNVILVERTPRDATSRALLPDTTDRLRQMMNE